MTTWGVFLVPLATILAVTVLSLFEADASATTTTALFGFGLTIISVQQRENHTTMNSRLSELIEQTRQASHSLGLAEGRAAGADEASTARVVLRQEAKDDRAEEASR